MITSNDPNDDSKKSKPQFSYHTRGGPFMGKIMPVIRNNNTLPHRNVKFNEI